MAPKLRIIVDPPRSAEFNMAADLYLLKTCAKTDTVYVRFYSWLQPTISLGYAQKPAELLIQELLLLDSIGWIRRPTGGRAVLHDEDVTYACVFPKSVLQMGCTISETYQLISRCLLQGLGYAGIESTAHPFGMNSSQIKTQTRLPCFLAPNRNEIMVNGKKLVGSAQKRITDAVLQHGSIPLSDKFRRLPLYQKISRQERQKQLLLMQQRCTCIRDCTPLLDVPVFVRHMQRGFIDIISLAEEIATWDTKEVETIQQYAENEKFSSRSIYDNSSQLS